MNSNLNLFNMIDESFEYIAQGFETYPLPIFFMILTSISIFFFLQYPFFSIQGSTKNNNTQFEEMVQKLVSRANKHSTKSIKNQHKDIIVAYKESVTALSLLNCAMVLIEESKDSDLQFNIIGISINEYYKNLTNFKNDIEVRIDSILIAG